MQILKLNNVKILMSFKPCQNSFDINQNKRIIFAGDFDVFFSSKLEAGGSKPIPKKNPL